MYYLANRKGFLSEEKGEIVFHHNVRYATVFDDFQSLMNTVNSSDFAIGPFVVLRPSVYADRPGCHRGMFVVAAKGGFLMDLRKTKCYGEREMSVVKIDDDCRKATVFPSLLDALSFCENTILHDRYYAVLALAYGGEDQPSYEKERQQ